MKSLCIGASENECEIVLRLQLPMGAHIIVTFKTYAVSIPFFLDLIAVCALELIVDFNTRTLVSIPGVSRSRT